MKKSLSLILAIAMVFTMFASVAFAAEASLDTNAKYEELKKAGIFEGTDGGAAALDQPLTRAQFAKIIVKVLDLKEDAASASIFNDLAGAGWASGFIGAAVKAGLVEGVAPGKFDPSANVTTEQLAKLLVLGLKLQQSNDAVTGNVSAWAKGYVAAAIKANLIPASADYTKPALRAALVEATYAAKEIIAKGQQPATVGIASVKATSAQVLTVSFTGAVDTAKAKFAVKRDESAVTVKEVKFSDDKKSATLTFESKLVEADYEVTLSGIDNLDSAKAKATAKVEAEKVSKIEFITASETIPQAKDVRIEFKVVNQYGEDVKVAASDLDIDVTGVEDSDWEEVSGLSAIELDLSNEEEYDRNDRVNVQITDDASRLSASKVFTIGDEQYISKVEIGKLLDKAGKEISSVEEGDDDIYLQVFAYDQYGIRVLDKDILNDDIDLSGSSDIDVYATESARFADDVDEDKFPDLRIQVEADADEGEQTITIFASGSSASKKITILTESKPASVKFDVSSITLSTLDGNVGSTDSSSVLYATYVPITVLNEAGDPLTKDEIATAAGSDDLLEVDANGSVDDAYIVQSGAFKGQVYVKGENDTGNGTVEITIDNKPTEKATLKVKVSDAREVQEIRLTNNNGDKGINVSSSLLAETKFKFAAFDQYGAVATEDKYTTNKDDDAVDYVVQLTLTGGAATVNLSDNQTLYSDFNTATGALTTPVTGSSSWAVNTVVYGTFDQISNKEIKLKAAAAGVYKVKAELLKKEQGDNGYSQADEVTKTYEVLDTTGETYVWSATLDKGVKDANGVYVVPNLGNLTTDATNNTNIEQLGKEIKLSAKDGSETVLVPNAITKVTLANSDAVAYVPTPTGGKAFVAAGDDKETTFVVTFKTNKADQTVALKVKGINDAFNISEFTGGKAVRVVAKADLAVGDDIWSKDLLDEIKGVDKTYGTEYSKAEFGNVALGVSYTIVEQQNADDALVIDADGTISTLTLNHASGSFTIKLTAPSGAEKLLELGYN